MNIKRTNKLVGVMLTLLFVLLPVHATEPWYRAITYSDLTFNAAEGESYGLEVVMVPSSDGMQVLWRSGSGRMERALLLDAVEEGKNYVVDVPPVIDGSGRWVLSIKEREMVAKGPRGQIFRLKKMPS